MKTALFIVLLSIFVLSNQCPTSISDWLLKARVNIDSETAVHTFTCPSGSTVWPRNGTETDFIVTRCINGEWTPNLAEHKCESIRCPRLKNSPCYSVSWTGQDDDNDGPEVGTFVEFSPNPGYLLNGMKEIECVLREKFKARLKGNRPKCMKLCKQPRLPRGQIYDDKKNPIEQDDLFPGKEYFLRCEEGYKIKKGTSRYVSCNNRGKIRYKGRKPRCVVRRPKNPSKQ